MDASVQEQIISALLSSADDDGQQALKQAGLLLDSLTVRAPAEGVVHQVRFEPTTSGFLDQPLFRWSIDAYKVAPRAGLEPASTGS